MKDENEDEIELTVFPRLRHISEKIEAIQKQKSVESKCATDYEMAKTKFASAKRAAESNTGKNIDQNKIELYKNEMDECETRLEKERDIYVSYMYDLLAEEDAIINCLVDYVELQRKYFSEAMQYMTDVTNLMRDIKGESIFLHLCAIFFETIIILLQSTKKYSEHLFMNTWNQLVELLHL